MFKMQAIKASEIAVSSGKVGVGKSNIATNLLKHKFCECR